jgi:hypothetical protein
MWKYIRNVWKCVGNMMENIRDYCMVCAIMHHNGVVQNMIGKCQKMSDYMSRGARCVSTEMWHVGTQHKDLDEVRNDVEDLVGLRGTLNSKSGSEGLLLVHKSMMYRVCMLRNLRLKR